MYVSFSRLPNCVNVESWSWSGRRKLFQSLAALAAKLRGPKMSVLVARTCRSPWADERRRRRLAVVLTDTHALEGNLEQSDAVTCRRWCRVRRQPIASLTTSGDHLWMSTWCYKTSVSARRVRKCLWWSHSGVTIAYLILWLTCYHLQPRLSRILVSWNWSHYLRQNWNNIWATAYFCHHVCINTINTATTGSNKAVKYGFASNFNLQICKYK